MRHLLPLLLAISLIAGRAAAQTGPIVSLVPDDAARWDTSATIGARAVNSGGTLFDPGDWANAGSFGASVGYHWTTHLKSELDLATTTEADQYVQDRTEADGRTLYVFGERRYRTTTLSAGALYQFGQNAWVHPFVGGGFETARERTELDVQAQPLCTSGPCVPVPLPVETRMAYAIRPYLTGGFKWYVSERAFIRTDVRAVLSSDRTEAVLWRFSLGADF